MLWTKQQVNEYVKAKKAGYTFVSEYRISYHGLKKYLKTRYGKGLKDIKGFESDYVSYYKEDILQEDTRSFEDRYGIKYTTFRHYIRREYGQAMSEVERCEWPYLVREYKKYRNRKRTSIGYERRI
jgi:hypothetical protein